MPFASLLGKKVQTEEMPHGHNCCWVSSNKLPLQSGTLIVLCSSVASKYFFFSMKGGLEWHCITQKPTQTTTLTPDMCHHHSLQCVSLQVDTIKNQWAIQRSAI